MPQDSVRYLITNCVAPFPTLCRAEYVRNTKKCDVKEYVNKLFDAEVAAEAERTTTTPTELALKDDALRSSGR